MNSLLPEYASHQDNRGETSSPSPSVSLGGVTSDGQRVDRILRDPEPLQPLSDAPDGQPLCREAYLNEMLSLLSGLLQCGNGRNLFICGKPGTGKTLCVQHLLSEICHKAVENGVPLAAGYVNAGKTRKPYFTMLEILRSLGVDVPDSGWQMFRLKQAFEKILSERAVLVAVDEFDAVLLNQREPLIYYLSRQPRTTLILVSNRLEDISTLPPRLLSTLQPRIIRLEPYTAEEAQLILRGRAGKALQPGTVSEELLAAIAQTTAGAEDIRLGFAILLTAAHIAEERGKTRIEAGDVQSATRSESIPSILKEMDALKQKLKARQKDRHDPIEM